MKKYHWDIDINIYLYKLINWTLFNIILLGYFLNHWEGKAFLNLDITRSISDG